MLEVKIYGKALSDSELLLVVEGEEYYVSIEQDSIYFTSSNNNKLKVYEFIPDNQEYFEEQLGKDSQRLVAETKESQTYANGAWILAASHLKGTSTMILQAVSELSTVSGAICWACTVAGVTGLSIVGVFGYVGQKLTTTLYTDYDKYYKGDCTTYIHQYIRYYQYSNYSGYMGAGNTYFHTVRPDYAGQNCIAYV